MMNAGRMPVGRAASRLFRNVATKSEAGLHRSVSTIPKTVLLSTRAGLGVTHAAPRLAAVNIPIRQFSGSPADIKGVEAATINWRDTVTSNTPDAPKKTAALYSDDCVFWGTVSEQMRQKPEHVYDYFDFFARLPKLSMVAYDPEPPRIHANGNYGIHAGAYTFAWEADGKMVETRARFTFGYRKEKDGWIIVEHHSSKMPTAPPSLKPAK